MVTVVGMWGMGVEASVDFVVVVVGERWFALGRVRRRGGGRRVFRRTGLRAGFGSVPQSHSGQDAEDVHVEVHGPGKDRPIIRRRLEALGRESTEEQSKLT